MAAVRVGTGNPWAAMQHGFLSYQVDPSIRSERVREERRRYYPSTALSILRFEIPQILILLHAT